MKLIGSPDSFLHKWFPPWENMTHMIPPITPSSHTDESMLQFNQHSYGECIIYDLLKEVGESNNIGMFVIHGFQMKNVPNFPSFIIFHHALGIISLDVKSIKEPGDVEDTEA